MTDFDFETPGGGADPADFSLEAILAEFRSAQHPDLPPEPGPPAHPLTLDEDEDDIGAASISSVDELLFPESEPEPLSEPEPEPEAEPVPEVEPELEREAEPEPEIEDEFAASAEPDPALSEPEQDDSLLSGYDESGSDDLYAGAVIPEPEQEPEPRSAPKPTARGGFGERLLTGIIALLALASMRHRQKKEAPAPPPSEEKVPEMPAANAVRFYTAQLKPLRLRFFASLFVSLILVYISFGYSAEFPLLGAMRNVRVAALYSLIAELCVMLLGLDVFTHGLTALVRGRPGSESLVAVSCIASALDAVFTAAAGGGAHGLPFCAVSALSVTFTLWGGQLSCRGYRSSFRALALGKNPMVVTAERAEESRTFSLVKTQAAPAGFIRRSEEADPCEELSAVCAPFLLAAAPVLALVASVGRGAPGSFFHIYAALAAVCAPFSAAYCFPLLFSLAARRLAQSGAAIAGWAGIRDIGRGKQIVLTDGDLFPPGTLSVGGIRILEGVYTDKVISYTGSMLVASGSGLAPLFSELMRKNGCSMQRVEDFSVGEGGIRAFIRGEEVCVGTSGFMHLCGVRLPQKLAAKNAVFTAASGALIGIITINYAALPSVQGALASLTRGKRKPVFAVRDFNIDPLLVRQKFRTSTDGFEFPSFADRYRISGAAPAAESPVAAVLARDGLAPFAEIAERGLRLNRAARLCAVLTLLCSAIGLLLMFLLSWEAAFSSANAGNLITYMLLWLVPVAVMAFRVRQ
jgi:hypothetical protein